MQSTSDQCGGRSNGSEDEPEIVSDNAKHTKGTRSKSNIKKKHEIKDNPNKKVTKKSNAKSKIRESGASNEEIEINNCEIEPTKAKAGNIKARAPTRKTKAGTNKVVAGTSKAKAGKGKAMAGTSKAKAIQGKAMAGTSKANAVKGKAMAGTSKAKAGTSKVKAVAVNCKQRKLNGKQNVGTNSNIPRNTMDNLSNSMETPSQSKGPTTTADTEDSPQTGDDSFKRKSSSEKLAPRKKKRSRKFIRSSESDSSMER